MCRSLLERELHFLQRNLTHYLSYFPAGHETWRPTPESYTLLDLASHLYTQPAMTAAVLRGAPEPEILRLAGGPWPHQTPADLQTTLNTGMSDLLSVLMDLADRDFAQQEVPWPFGALTTPQHHLMMLITHIYHHRGQFHLYLKQLGKPVTTETVYQA